MKKLRLKKRILMQASKSFFWFVTGAMLAFFLLTSFTFIIFEKINTDIVYPGIVIENIDLGRKTEQEVYEIFAKKNEDIANIQFTFWERVNAATISAKNLGFGYDQNLIAKQAISLGRSGSFLSNVSLVFQAYTNGLPLRTWGLATIKTSLQNKP